MASSWRNAVQPSVVEALRAAGHKVYDFRHPHEGNDGFSWRSIDGGWQSWSPDAYVRALEHPVAREGFRLDMEALETADATVLVLPCGRSAHLELGYARGLGQRTAVLLAEPFEPELMYRMVDRVCPTLDELLAWLREGAPANGQERYLCAARRSLASVEEILTRGAAREACTCDEALEAAQRGLDYSRPPCPPEDIDDAPRPVFA